MAVGIYIHIPYCLQRCSYCDFATYEHTSILPKAEYFDLLHREIEQRHQMIQDRRIKSVYFGGGTPSLAEPHFIIAVLEKFSNLGFQFTEDIEITIEINPATLNIPQLDELIAGGVNRFSVGAQTFHNRLLKLAGRRHNVNDTLQTLDYLRTHQTNYTLDLLFALPTQTMEELERDLDHIVELTPPHVSAYCLTVPDKHPMSYNRPIEETQLEMFTLIEQRLGGIGLARYEISNFARPGSESRHNLIYWQNEPFWGVGLSAHSYLTLAPWGIRFWNPSDIAGYVRQIRNQEIRFDLSLVCPDHAYPKDQIEVLELHQALTDYCHMRLRTTQGLSLSALCSIFPPLVVSLVQGRLQDLVDRGWLELEGANWKLTPKGLLLSNQVFLELTFLHQDVSRELSTQQRKSPNLPGLI